MPDVIWEETLANWVNHCELVCKQLGFPMDREWAPFRNENKNHDGDEDEETSSDDD
jgi:hypothetical protein